MGQQTKMSSFFSDFGVPVVAAAALVVVGYGAGSTITGQEYEAKIAAMEAAQAEALKEAHAKNGKNLADATNTILLAQDEYNAVRGERDRLLVRLRNSRGGGSGDGSSDGALRARVAALEGMVERLSADAARCDDGWANCSKKHDALTEILK